MDLQGLAPAADRSHPTGLLQHGKRARPAADCLGDGDAGPRHRPGFDVDRGRRGGAFAATHRDLSPSLTEAVCALGHCAQLVGTDRHSSWPVDVAALPKVGGLEDAQVERIVTLKPGVVLLGPRSRAGERLSALGVPVPSFDARTHADLKHMLLALGRMLGEPARAAELVQRLEAELDAAARRMPPAWRGRSVYVEVGAGPYAASDKSFVGDDHRPARPGQCHRRRVAVTGLRAPRSGAVPRPGLSERLHARLHRGLQAPGKFTFLLGNLAAESETAAQLLACTRLHAGSADGAMPRGERPGRLRSGILARLPPPVSAAGNGPPAAAERT